MEGNKQYRLLKEHEWEDYQKMAEEANIREEIEAKSKEAQVNRLISSIQANVRVLISVLFPRLCRLIWRNPDSIIKEIFARGMQNPDNYWFWNRESWDLKSGIQAKRSGIPLTIVPRTGICEFLFITRLKLYIIIHKIWWYLLQNNFFKELRNKI